MEKVIIMGSGPAGYTAAIYACRAGLSPLIISGNVLGGQAGLTAEVENYPGFPEAISGFELMERMKQQAERLGTRVVIDEVTAADLSSRPFKLTTHGSNYETEALIIATGVAPRKLGVPGEKEYTGRGVSYCATCDGFFYKGKTVAVVGGGDAAVEEALYLSRLADKVYVIHRRNRLRAQQIAQDRARRRENISFIWNSVVRAILGAETVNAVLLNNMESGEESTLPVDGVFIYIGSDPNTRLFVGQLELDANGYIVTDRRCHTSVPGVFAAGDVQELVLKQIATAVGTGAIAAMEADKFLAELEDRAYPPRQ
ncbi:MAG: thioredoxin-disulfide reductase [Chloroflexi bacterium]|nr:thioredoxin-disulfide reductase [Chloroflexota bacterium]